MSLLSNATLSFLWMNAQLMQVSTWDSWLQSKPRVTTDPADKKSLQVGDVFKVKAHKGSFTGTVTEAVQGSVFAWRSKSGPLGKVKSTRRFRFFRPLGDKTVVVVEQSKPSGMLGASKEALEDENAQFLQDLKGGCEQALIQ
jgi:hypothetical protein